MLRVRERSIRAWLSWLTSSTRPRCTDQLAAALATTAAAARGNTQGQDQEQIQRLERPRGEAGDQKNGFILQDAMGLEGDREQHEAILVSDCSEQVMVLMVRYHLSAPFAPMSYVLMSTLPSIFAVRTQPSSRLYINS